MVSSFTIPQLFLAQLHKLNKYKLFLLSSDRNVFNREAAFHKIMPAGHIWYQRRNKQWKTTLSFETGYLGISSNNVYIGTMYVEKRVATKMHLFDM